MSRTNLGDCIKTANLTFTGATIKKIPALPGASKALLEFYTDAAGALAIGESVLFYTPIVCITENGDVPDVGYAGVKGIRLLNFASVIISGKNNLTNAQMIPFAAGYTVYCQIHYYK